MADDIDSIPNIPDDESKTGSKADELLFQPEPDAAKKRARNVQQELVEVVLPAEATAPDLEVLRKTSPTQRMYWLGLLPEAPVEAVTIGGLRLTKNQQLIRKDPAAGPNSSKTVRIPVYGGLQPLSRDMLAKFGEELARTVFRFRGSRAVNKTQVAEITYEGTEETTQIVERTVTARKGFAITIPTEQEQRVRRCRPYIPQPDDAPMSRFVWCVPTEDNKPKRGQDIPPTVAETGLRWVPLT